MEEYKRSGQEGKNVFVGVDLHRFKWHVTVLRGEVMEYWFRQSLDAGEF